jgi:hypothetical protein
MPDPENIRISSLLPNDLNDNINDNGMVKLKYHPSFPLSIFFAEMGFDFWAWSALPPLISCCLSK